MTRLQFFTVLATGYFLTTFALRLVIPAMSLEGRAAWLFFSSPIQPMRFLIARASLYVGCRPAAPDRRARTVCLVYVAVIASLGQRTALVGAAGGSVVPWLTVAAAISGALVLSAGALARRRRHELEAP